MSGQPVGEAAVAVTRRGHLPFAQVSVAIARRPDLSTGAKALYMLLCTYADVHTRGSFPKRSTLATDLGLDPKSGKRSITRWSAELVDAGVLRIQARTREDGSQSSNSYELLDAQLIKPLKPGSDDWFHDRRVEAIVDKRDEPW